MATVMYIPEKKQSLGAMKGVMGYVCQEKKTRDPVTGQRFVTGVHCLGGQCLSGISGHQAHLWQDEGHELLPVRAILLSKRGGDFGESPRHRFGSLPKKLGRASRCWWPLTGTPGTCIPTLWVNSVSWETGLKLRQSPKTLQTLRALSDEICAARGSRCCPGMRSREPSSPLGSTGLPRRERAGSSG